MLNRTGIYFFFPLKENIFWKYHSMVWIIFQKGILIIKKNSRWDVRCRNLMFKRLKYSVTNTKCQLALQNVSWRYKISLTKNFGGERIRRRSRQKKIQSDWRVKNYDFKISKYCSF